MADLKSFDEILATGEAPCASPMLVSAPKSPATSTHASVKHQTDEAQGEQGEHEEHDGLVDQSARPITETIVTETVENRSPVPSTNFSEAPTLLTRTSTYTAKTGGRARQSWRGGVANMWRPSSTISSNDADASDPSVAPGDSFTSSSTDIPTVEVDPIELPAALVAKSDEPRSFFESYSESEGDTTIRTASRASSLRGEHPKLVQHHSSNHSLRRKRFYQSALLAPPRNPGPSHSKAEQILGTKLKNLLDLTPADESADPMASVKGGAAAALNALTANEMEAPSTTALAPTPPSPQRSVDSSLVIEVPNTPSRAEALETLPTPLGEFGTLRLGVQANPGRFGSISPLDALRSNPVTQFDTLGLHRATSAPPLPHRRHRKVTIRPVDMEVIHSAQEKKLFRDNVVSTPYPARHGSLPGGENTGTPISPIKSIHLLSSTKEEVSKLSPTVSQISPPEILILEISLARHALATKMITVPIYDRSTYDDCALFTTIRHTYNHTLLGFTRRFLTARALSNATFCFPSSAMPFDAADFFKHLSHPKSGHRRKTWLQWLRKHQPRLITASSSTSKQHRSGSQSSEPYFSPDGIPRTPTFLDPRPPPPPPPPTSSTQSHPSPISAPPSSSPPSPASSTSPSPVAIPKLTLHHTFSLPRIAVAISLVLFLTVLATVLWVLFGRPGPSAGAGLEGSVGGLDWRVAAQGRVMTGLIVGLLVFLMGALGVLGWVGGSWAVL